MYSCQVILTHSEHLVVLITHKRSIYEFYAQGTTYDQVHKMNSSNKHLWEKYIPDTSFKFIVSGFNHTIPQRRQHDVIESFSYMDFRGKIDMKNPEITMACFEECPLYLSPFFGKMFNNNTAIDDSRPAPANGPSRKRCEDDGQFREVFFGRLVRCTLMSFGYSDLIATIDSGRYCATIDWCFRREETSLFWKH